MKKINVLGTLYAVIEGNQKKYPGLRDCDGYCDDTIRACIVDDHADMKGDPLARVDIGLYKKKVTRHELIHAFLYESGLAENSAWAQNEEMVDWIAYQFPKLLAAFQAADCL